jgi:hypothetical protein
LRFGFRFSSGCLGRLGFHTLRRASFDSLARRRRLIKIEVIGIVVVVDGQRASSTLDSLVLFSVVIVVVDSIILAISLSPVSTADGRRGDKIDLRERRLFLSPCSRGGSVQRNPSRLNGDCAIWKSLLFLWRNTRTTREDFRHNRSG